MITASKEARAYYEKRKKKAHAQWLCRLTAKESFALYCSMYDLARQANAADPETLQQSQARRRKEKLTIRRKMVDAFLRLDQLRNGKISP